MAFIQAVAALTFRLMDLPARAWGGKTGASYRPLINAQAI